MTTAPSRTVLDMNRYQWLVLFAAWLGWGFDVFDGLLFNFVAPICIPKLLGRTARPIRAAARDVDRRDPHEPARRLGDRRHPVRQDHRPHRPHAHAARHDAHLRAGHRGLRVRPQHLDVLARFASSRRSASAASGRPARRWSPRACPRTGASRRRAALHVRAPLGLFLATFVNDLFTPPARRVRGGVRTLVAGRVPDRAGARRRRAHRPHVHASRSAGRPPRRAPRSRACASSSRRSSGARPSAGSRWRSSRSSPGGAVNAFIQTVSVGLANAEAKLLFGPIAPRRWRWASSGRRSRPTCSTSAA